MNETTMGAFLLPEGFRRPAAVAMLREGLVVGEAGRSVVHSLAERRARRRRPYAGPAVQRHGDPVLLVPGFFAGDYSLRTIAAHLRSQGWRTYRAHILANVDCTLSAAALLESRIERIVERREQKVQIVGHSLGGMLARGIAVRRPDLVSGIVTMGSPMMAPGAHHRALTAGAAALVALNRVGVPGLMASDCVGGDCARQSFEESRLPVPGDVAFTALWSRNDGIVWPWACIDPQADAVEVRASHLGMAVDPRVAREVSSALTRHRARRAGVESGTVTALGSALEVDRGVGA
ncbi:alpha/beta hydrolase [Nocardioides sp. TRM66260-LWL]|uniref:alpha/beta hydrolase n=1 Tax=Nocardioides sp. TRM66260-LWL TaxID=2874478 RepID=UPI001CC82CED|nr:alpha/beta hydrolase [Nocardioides sp. TRM66260-LWL]MBZ5736189.1 alpha/beta hydrolase [Nocardioides sp. TRM66260-LWL]